MTLAILTVGYIVFAGVTANRWDARVQRARRNLDSAA